MKRTEQARDAYGETLDGQDRARLALFEGVWDIQDHHGRAVAEADGYVVADPALSEAWYWQGRPFFLMAPVTVDGGRFAAALEDISCHLVDHAGLEEGLAGKMRLFDWRALVEKSDLEQAGCDPAAYVASCRGLVEEEDATFDSLMVALVLSYALRPMLEKAASDVMGSLAGALKEGNAVHDKPLRCPACGGRAAAACVGEVASGQGNGRLLYCGICGTEWEFERIRCGHCGTRNQGRLHYFNVEGDDAHRLHDCRECGGYMRTVFREDLHTPFSFVVEDVVMARLDHVVRDPRFDGREGA